MSIEHPARAGQAVTHHTAGGVGITTDGPRKRGGTIGVMWLGSPYSVLEQVESLTVIPAELALGLIARKPEPKVEEDEELIVYGYCVVDRDGDFISPFEKQQQDAIDYAAGQNKDCQDAGIDWDYRVAAIVDQGGL